jgi:hypothetical protein
VAVVLYHMFEQFAEFEEEKLNKNLTLFAHKFTKAKRQMWRSLPALRIRIQIRVQAFQRIRIQTQGFFMNPKKSLYFFRENYLGNNLAFLILKPSVADPNPYNFGPPGSRS